MKTFFSLRGQSECFFFFSNPQTFAHSSNTDLPLLTAPTQTAYDVIQLHDAPFYYPNSTCRKEGISYECESIYTYVSKRVFYYCDEPLVMLVSKRVFY